ncbi:hypothetical protein BDR05DRAFT_963972, partial [Suillus weaverae]
SDFFGSESDRAAPPASPSSLFRWRRLLTFVHSGTPPASSSQPTERQSGHWNFNFFSGGNSSHTVEV